MAQEGKKGKDMRLKITDCRQAYVGHSKRGDTFTIYEVKAERPDGREVNEKLRSFSSLPVGQVIEVNVQPYNSEVHGRSFTLYPKGSKGTGATAQLNELHERVTALEGKINTIWEEWQLIKRQLNGSATPAVRPAAQPGEQALDAQFGADAPW